MAEPSKPVSAELGVEFLLTLLMFLYPYGAEQMNLPRNFWLGMGCWLAGTAIAIRMFWIFPAWARRLTRLEKSLFAFIFVGIFGFAIHKPVEAAYKMRNAIAPTLPEVHAPSAENAAGRAQAATPRALPQKGLKKAAGRSKPRQAPNASLAPSGRIVKSITQGPGSIAQLGTNNTATINNFVPPSNIQSWTQRSGPAFAGRATVVVTFTVDHSLEIPAFAAVCSRPCEAIGYSLPGAAQGYFLSSASSPDIAGAVLNEPRPLGADLSVSLTFAAKDAKPFSVLRFGIIPADKVPPE